MCLMVLIDSDSCINTLAGLVALGSIVRWGDDNHIQVIIDEEGQSSLEYLEGEIDKYYVKDACWICWKYAEMIYDLFLLV